jgi:tRNA-splicing ligase RtcB (3'-phosphate/5'-hydroxy nucleic acid ligase)
MELKKITPYIWEIPKTGNMNVPGRLFSSEALLKLAEKDSSFEQVKNVASLPGIQKYAYAMPDMHQGYGFTIGGVAAFDLENGIITPGGIGFDINCGVRLLSTNLKEEQAREKIQELIDQLFKRVPCGIGRGSELKVDDKVLDQVMLKGPKWAVSNKIGIQEDIMHCESNGFLEWASPKNVSQKARARGRTQLGTLGAGNHFLEVQYVDEIYDKETAKVFGINKKGQVMVMIHCGSRGLGHQICSDYLRKMEDAYPDIVSKLPEKDLIYAPFDSKLGQEYFSAMACAANFAWANRHIIANNVRKAFERVFEGSELKTVYDVAHNIAKIEEHSIEGVKKKLIVHRKGATRCFPAGHPELTEDYMKTGHPVIIPGSMGTSSYVLVGTKETMEIAFGSTAHGAGRVMSRHEANKSYRGESVKSELMKKNILIKSASWKGISEEAPQVYKDIDEVIKITEKAGISRAVARVRPIGVIKG